MVIFYTALRNKHDLMIKYFEVDQYLMTAIVNEISKCFINFMKCAVRVNFLDDIKLLLVLMKNRITYFFSMT